jgi:hypothetical protein
MTQSADDRLKALFAEDEPPARDPVFSTAVMAEIARRQFQDDVVLLSGVTLIGGVILWALWPSLTPVVTSLSQGMAPVAACLTLAAVVIRLAGGRPGAALGFEHD